MRETFDLAPALTLYELLALLNALPLESQRLHYLVKRHALEAVTLYNTHEGEYQLLEHYLRTAFHFLIYRDFAKNPLRIH